VRENLDVRVQKTTSIPLTVCVVIPAFKVSEYIVNVVKSIGPEVSKIIVVDDACPESSGRFLEKAVSEPRLEVIYHASNKGVGGAVKTGYLRALELGYEIMIKIDGDGQMDSSKIMDLIEPILADHSDYTKGNRFFEIDAVQQMPKIRVLGNLGLTFMTKFSTGLWHIFDPNNGFTAVRGTTLKKLNLNKIDDRYFFESDMLFRVNLLQARVKDVPLPAIYGKEKSNLNVKRVLFEFPAKHTRNYLKRIAYTYYLRDFNLASIELPLGLLLIGLGLTLGGYSWIHGIITTTPTPTGTLILVAMSFLAGLQLILAFLSYDTNKFSNPSN
jgi:glycosyltransferase involved in cell wall biosynthesis